MSKTLRDTYTACLAQLPSVDLATPEQDLGIQIDGSALLVPFFNESYRVGSGKIVDSHGGKPTDGVGIVLCQYLLRCPNRPLPDGPWVTFRELPGAGPLVSSFTANTNKLIAGTFGGRIEPLRKRIAQLHGQSVPDQSGYDLFVRFEALPKVPIFMQFNAADDQFSAQCGLLFFQSANRYLDMQSLFIIGTYLTGYLIRGLEA